MVIRSDTQIYSALREEHLVHNDFFVRFLAFDSAPSQLALVCFAGGKACFEVYCCDYDIFNIKL